VNIAAAYIHTYLSWGTEGWLLLLLLMLVACCCIQASTESSEFPYDYTRQALEKTIAEKCDVDNMSLGGFYVTPSKQLTPTIAKVIAADIIVTAAQGNDDAAVQTGARIFNVASPGAFDEVFSIGHVNNTANPGSVLQLDKPVQTASGKSTKIGEHTLQCMPETLAVKLASLYQDRQAHPVMLLTAFKATDALC